MSIVEKLLQKNNAFHNDYKKKKQNISHIENPL